MTDLWELLNNDMNYGASKIPGAVLCDYIYK